MCHYFVAWDRQRLESILPTCRICPVHFQHLFSLAYSRFFFSLSHFHLTFLVMCPQKWINEHKVIVVIVGSMSTR